MNSLTYDAILEVLSRLSVADLGRLAQVSREANALVDDRAVWRRLCRGLDAQWAKIINRPIHQVPRVLCSADWKETFRTERGRMATTAKFVGLWSEKWCDVNVAQSTTIESDGHVFSVTYKKNKFVAEYLDFDGETLTFHLEGGDSGWAFIYKLRPVTDSLLHLCVFRIHDQKSFTGIFARN